MAHYAFLNESNIVTEVIIGVDENELLDGLNPEVWYGNFRGQKCRRTSYNTYHNIHSLDGKPFRKNYASVGFFYDEYWDAFIPPKPFDNWKLDYTIFDWMPPIAMPVEVENGYEWKWAQDLNEWIKTSI
jgi:hypothetical protein